MEDGTEKAIFDDAEILGNSIRDAVETFKKNHPGRRVELKNEHGSINLVCSHLILSLCFLGNENNSAGQVGASGKLEDSLSDKLKLKSVGSYSNDLIIQAFSEAVNNESFKEIDFHFSRSETLKGYREMTITPNYTSLNQSDTRS